MKKSMLIIMDGWGHGQKPPSDAIYQASTPFVKGLYQRFPHTELTTFGEAVGLPDDQMGNSEVGHLNLGAGRIVYQELLRINRAIEQEELAKNQVLLDAFGLARQSGKKLHFIGLVSDGGVHSQTRHLEALCKLAAAQGLPRDQVLIHAFTDGRDTDPRSGAGYLETLLKNLAPTTGTLASVIGRYYAMDRDNRWDRIRQAYDLLVKGKGTASPDALATMRESYAAGVTDEFMKPIVCTDAQGHPQPRIQAGDVVICFNFRTDRCREITKALTQQDFPEQEMHKLDLHYVTMTVYDHSFQHVEPLFRNNDLPMTMGEVMEKNKLKQLRIAETEKYPHVTFFFSGGREKPFEGERRIMIPSPKVATYDLQPEMSAFALKDAVVKELKEETADFICLNFANADMVGHTGVFAAAVRAVEAVDACVQEVVETALAHGYAVWLTADHGNCDYLINEDGSPNTAHTKNPVPLFLLEKENRYQLRPGKLADVAPSMLTLMELEIPAEMTGDILIHPAKK